MSGSDPYDLQRFIKAQERSYKNAISEIQSGHKVSHWMWYIFPQFAGLGFSNTSVFYAIKSLAEARAYLAHPVLGVRLKECLQVLLALEGYTARDIFGSPDDLKLCSCATLFAQVSSAGSLFEQVLFKYFAGEPDPKTLELLGCRSEHH